MKRALTDRWIERAEPDAKLVTVSDAKMPNLVLRIWPGGAKAFSLQYRYKGRPCRLDLGRFGVIGVAEARKRALAAKVQLSQGIDPGQEKRAQRMNADTFSALVDDFVESYAKQRKSWREAARILKRDFVSRWGKRRPEDITRDDVVHALRLIAKPDNRSRSKPSAANHAFAHVRKLFRWAASERSLPKSPCTGLSMPFKAVKRKRVLSIPELRAIWRSADAMGYPFGPIVHLLILTAQRRSEVVASRWTEFNDDFTNWIIPGDRTKIDYGDHVVPLSPLARVILSRVPRSHDLIFASQGSSRAVSGFSKWKKSLDKRSGVVGWRLHDLRRTTATALGDLGVHPHIVEAILNHSTGSMSPIARVYNRSRYLPKLRAALHTWSDFVTAQLAMESPAAPSDTKDRSVGQSLKVRLRIRPLPRPAANLTSPKKIPRDALAEIKNSDEIQDQKHSGSACNLIATNRSG